MRTQNPNLSCASNFVRQSRTFHSSNALCTLSHAHVLKLTKHSIMNTIRVWSGSKPCLQMEREGRERERARERLVQARQSKHCISGSASREREREREMCVFFLNFVSFFVFYSGNLLRISKFCVDLCKKIWSYDMSSGINSWVQSRTQNFWVRGTILAGILSRQSERKRGRTK